MSFPRKKVSAVLGTAVAIAGVSAGIAFGQAPSVTGTPVPPASATMPATPTPESTTPESTTPEAGGSEKDGGELAPNASSVQAPNTPDVGQAAGQSAADEAAADKAESAKLATLATVSQAQAEQAAIAKVPGKVVVAELGDENGNVVWQVEVTATDSTQHEVMVDAGNGTVLSSQVDSEG